jgi:hypothetical protein
MRIDGLWELKRTNKHFARAGEVSLIVGKPLRYSTQTAPEVISQDLERHVKILEV